VKNVIKPNGIFTQGAKERRRVLLFRAAFPQQCADGDFFFYLTARVVSRTHVVSNTIQRCYER
jgi:hypothetical protein